MVLVIIKTEQTNNSCIVEVVEKEQSKEIYENVSYEWAIDYLMGMPKVSKLIFSTLQEGVEIYSKTIDVQKATC